MHRYTYETIVETPPDKLYAAITDISRWPVWALKLEQTTHDGSLQPGAPFTLKPKGGPTVKLTVEVARANAVFSDLAQLPLAKMRTRHEFEPVELGTRVRVTIEVFGLLAFLWDRVVARPQAVGLADRTQAFIRFAEGRQ